jgi:hypothetical protein
MCTRSSAGPPGPGPHSAGYWAPSWRWDRDLPAGRWRNGIGPAVRVAAGHGIHGYYVAKTESCDDQDNCSWTGEFRLANGTVSRKDVGFAGSDSGLVQGTVVPALDTGDRSSVYQENSSGQWIQPAFLLLLGVLFLAGFGRTQLRRVPPQGRLGLLAASGRR